MINLSWVGIVVVSSPLPLRYRYLVRSLSRLRNIPLEAWCGMYEFERRDVGFFMFSLDYDVYEYTRGIGYSYSRSGIIHQQQQ